MKDAVVLIPGFLGFNKTGNFSYFADRVIATLSGALTALEAPMPIIPFSTLPVGSLVDRQTALLTALAEVDADQLHLIGHSTGGVDAELLTRTDPIGGRADLWNSLRPKLRTVVTLAAPHFGTTLTVCDAAEMIRTRHPTREGLKEVAELTRAAVTHDLAERLMVLQGAAEAAGGGGAFSLQLLRNPLLHDLTPEAMWNLYDRNPRAPKGTLDIQVSYYATATPLRPVGDELFGELSLLLQTTIYVADHDAPHDVLEAARTRINSPATTVFTSGVVPDRLVATLGMNDGVVNTVRQVLPGGVLAGVVLGDHGDVLGHYQRVDTLTGRILNPGLLTCGAGFDDATFFNLYTDIARTIQLRVLS